MCKRETVRGVAEDFSLAYCLFCLVIIISTICQGAYDKQETEQCCQEEMQDERKHNRVTSRRWGRGGWEMKQWQRASVCLTCVCLRVIARMYRSMHLCMTCSYVCVQRSGRSKGYLQRLPHLLAACLRAAAKQHGSPCRQSCAWQCYVTASLAVLSSSTPFPDQHGL